MVEHKIDLIAEYADEVLVFKEGRLIASGDKQELLSDLSLLDQGAALPQVAILGSRLRERGLPVSRIPVTEKQAIELIAGALKERDKK